MSRPLCLALLTIGLSCGSAHAQVFVAAEPSPQFAVGPVFVSARITPALGSVPVSISWSLVVPPHGATPRDADLFLLLPFTATGTVDRSGTGDLAEYVKRRGFTVKETGHLALAARNRSTFGTGGAATPVGGAPYVVFFRDGPRGPSRPATYVRIPWTPRMIETEWLTTLTMTTPDVIKPKRVSWIEETFWGPRYVATLSFGDVGSTTLYPLYFELRRHVVPIAQDYSLVLLSFDSANHLRLYEVVPSTATRRASEVREDVESLSIPLVASAGIEPQTVRAEFIYFRGRIAWRPIIISLLFLLLGNATGPLLVPLIRRMFRHLGARVQFRRSADDPRTQQSGVIVPRQTLERIVPGETTYEEVVRLCGPLAEVREQIPRSEHRTVVYRGRRRVPHRGWTLGWLAGVSHWEVEDHEVEIELDGDRVRDVRARVRRAEWRPEGGGAP